MRWHSGMMGRTPLAVALAAWFVCLLPVSLVTSAVGAEEPKFDFAGEAPAVNSKEDVIEGEVLIEGEVPQGLVMEIAYIVRMTISYVVGVPIWFSTATVSGDLRQLDKADGVLPRVLIRFAYQVLPPKGGAEASIKDILASGRKEKSGEFEEYFTTKLAEHEPTVNVNFAGWIYDIPTPTSRVLLVTRPVDMPVYTTTTEDILDESQRSTTTPYVPLYRSDPCLAAGHPCTCASLSGCKWAKDVNGRSKCQEAPAGSQGGVPCSACSRQAHCPGAACRALGQPCACAESESCRWHDEEELCVLRVGASRTSCSACATQNQCVPLELKRIVPQSGTQLVLPAQLQLRLEFDRIIHPGSSGAVSFKCDAQAMPTDLANEHLTFDGKVLLVSVSVLTSGANKLIGNDVLECTLIISAGRLKDSDGVPFLGLKAGKYVFKLGDSSPPTVSGYAPKNGEQDVPLTTSVTFTFNEDVSLGPGAAALKAMVGELGDADIVGGAVATEVALKPPRVAVTARELKLDLTGIITNGKHYTVSLPRGAVIDRARNVFSGLRSSVYAFRTVPAATVVHQDGGARGVPKAVLYSAIAGGASLVLLCIGMIWRISRLRRSHAAHLKTAGVKLSTVRPAAEREILERSKTAPAMTSPPMMARRNSHTQGWTEVGGSAVAGSPQGMQGRPRSGNLSSPDLQFVERTAAQRRWDTARRATASAAGRAAMQASEAREGPPRQAPAANGEEAPYVRESLKRARTTIGPQRPPQARSSPAPPEAAQPQQRGATDAQAQVPPKPRVTSTRPAKTPGAVEEGVSTPISVESATDPETEELDRQKADIERRMKSLLDTPLEERKKIMREMMLQYHPDKNSAPKAKELFQFVNSSRSWFVAEA